MTVPGVYSPEQIAAHVDKVFASDGVDDSRAVEVMARAMYDSYCFKKGWHHPDTVKIHHRHMLVAARAALGALRALEGK